ncbi:uncharacterized protein LOC110983515 isoform X1 [Acanthaster planci]|uniref:Uncharacterized protein LOC110983515 isoform X1 n=1 Tax=Acanthaster planci TaxID=133434 RepID=A0A8B7Z160_ACAPL|nr:uncharacterized protein LOC110983515 isoform X1 [Acanthaster planci]
MTTAPVATTSVLERIQATVALLMLDLRVVIDTEDATDQKCEQRGLCSDLFCLRRAVVSSCSNDTGQGTLNTYPEPEAATNYNVLRPLPTLVELCLPKIACSGEYMKLWAPFPPGLQPLMRALRNQQWLQQLRFSWLMKAIEEAERAVKDHIRPLSSSQCSEGHLLFRRHTRHRDSLMGWRQNPDLPYGPDMLALPEPVDGYDASDWCIAVVAHTIDMLLPTTMSEPVVTETVSALCDHSAAMAANVDSVRCLLSKWAPKLAQHCFDAALVYVWWSRGHIERAKQLLLQLLNHQIDDMVASSANFPETGLQIGLYLNELGRMMTHADQPELAGQFYRDAMEFAQDGSPLSINSSRLQSLALCAAAYDQGMMNQHYAVRAQSLWYSVLCEPDCPPELTQAAIVSLLHCHVSFSSQENVTKVDADKLWLKEMAAKLHDISLKDPSAYFYLSAVWAFLGKNDEAFEAYVNYSAYFSQTRGTEVPGSVVKSGPGSNQHYPWWKVSEWLASKSTATKDRNGRAFMCMPLLWRRNLGHTTCILGNQTSKRCVGDVCGVMPHFCITRDGFLTGCIMGNLPPMSNFLLNPHTGRPCASDHGRQLDLLKWDNFHSKQEGIQPGLRSVLFDASRAAFHVPCSGFLDSSYPCGFRIDTYLPTPIHLLTNRRTGDVFSLLVSNNIVDYNRHISKQDDWEFSVRFPAISHHEAVLICTSSLKNLKIDLRSVIVQAKRDAVLRDLGNNSECSSDYRRMNEAKILLQILVKHKCQIGVFLAQDIADNRQGSQVSKLKLALQRENLESLKDFLPPPQTIRVSNVLFVGENTAILSLLCAISPYNSQEDNTLVFADCDTANTFRNPVVHFTSSPDKSWKLPDQFVDWKSVGTNKKVFFVYESVISTRNDCSGEAKTLIVFDELGGILMKEVSNGRKTSGPHGCVNFFTCCGWNLLGFNYSRTGVISYNVRTRTTRTVRLPQVESLQVAGSVILVAVPAGVVALESINLLPLIVSRVNHFPVPLGTNTDEKTHSDALVVEGDSRFLQILTSSGLTDGLAQYSNRDEKRHSTRAFLGLINRVVILEISTESKALSCSNCCPLPTTLTVTADVILAGIPTELCFISQSVGFIVTTTVSKERHPLETEMMYWFDMSGNMRGVHPLLGPGPHGMTAVPLKDPDQGESLSEVQSLRWHLFFDDGLGGICCIRI